MRALQKLLKKLKLHYQLSRMQRRQRMNAHETEFDHDKHYSDLHRCFGDQCYAGDVDFVEFSSGTTPLMLTEVKCGLEAWSTREDWQRKLLIKLAEPRAAELPAMVIHRNEPATIFKLDPLNDTAKALLKKWFKKEEAPRYHWKDGCVYCDFIILRTFNLLIRGVKDGKPIYEGKHAKKHKDMAEKHTITAEQFHEHFNPPELTIEEMGDLR